MYKVIQGDQRTEDWHKLREGKITGSVAKQVKGTGDAFLYEMLAMMTTKRKPKQAYGEHVERGRDLEDEARLRYEQVFGNETIQCAFIENGQYGLSPDGLVMKTKGTGIKKLIEIKCPDTNNHIKYILTDKIPSEHKDQILHGFVVCDDVDEIDFVSYDPKFTFKPLHIITARRQDYYTDIVATELKYKTFTDKLNEAYKKLIL